MDMPKRCARPVRKLERLLNRSRYRKLWPPGLTARSARLACERGDINGLRRIADTVEARRDDPEQPENNEAGKLAALLRKIERHLGLAMIEESHRNAHAGTTATADNRRA